jgi:hypothetical protein
MERRELFHGTNGDNILEILRSRRMRPNISGKIFFSEHRFDSAFMHGPDLKRKLTFVIKARVRIPEGTTLQRYSTPGVAGTLVLNTETAVFVKVLDLYVRKPQGGPIETIHGRIAIERFLTVQSG